MRKEELGVRLKAGEILGDIMVFRDGQECEIFKAEEFHVGDEIIYIPDVYLNMLPVNKPCLDDEEADDVVLCCYTGRDFIDICDGDVEAAKRLFGYCDWQHPLSALWEVCDDDQYIWGE